MIKPNKTESVLGHYHRQSRPPPIIKKGCRSRQESTAKKDTGQPEDELVRHEYYIMTGQKGKHNDKSRHS